MTARPIPLTTTEVSAERLRDAIAAWWDTPVLDVCNWWPDGKPAPGTTLIRYLSTDCLTSRTPGASDTPGEEAQELIMGAALAALGPSPCTLPFQEGEVQLLGFPVLPPAGQDPGPQDIAWDYQATGPDGCHVALLGTYYDHAADTERTLTIEPITLNLQPLADAIATADPVAGEAALRTDVPRVLEHLRAHRRLLAQLPGNEPQPLLPDTWPEAGAITHPSPARAPYAEITADAGKVVTLESGMDSDTLYLGIEDRSGIPHILGRPGRDRLSVRITREVWQQIKDEGDKTLAADPPAGDPHAKEAQ